MNTSKSVSIQTTLSPFRLRTYAKPRGGVIVNWVRYDYGDPTLKFVTLLAALMISLPLAAQTQSKDNSDLLERVRKGHSPAVYELGQTNDPQYIPMLLALYKDPMYPPKPAAQLALAKLGSTMPCNTMPAAV